MRDDERGFGAAGGAGEGEERDDRFRRIFQHSNDAIFLLDPERDRILDANPRACRFLGYEREELLALGMSDVHPHELERLREFTGGVLAEGEGWTDELSCLGKDGEPRPSEISASVVSVEGERRVIALVRDVSRRREERRLLEETVERRTAALRRSETRLRTLLAVNNALVSHLEPRELFPSIAAALERVVAFDRLALLLYDAEGDLLTVASLAGDGTLLSTVPLGTEMKPSETLLGPVVRERTPLYVPDVKAASVGGDSGSPRHGRLLSLHRQGLTAFLGMPLLRQDRLLGVLVMGSRRLDPFTPDDVELLGEVAEQVALAVDNMLAYQEIERLRSRLEQEKLYLEEEIRSVQGFDELVGRSPALERVLQAVETVAPTDATVLILGETGTGKELVARAIHHRSGRADQPLVKVNCAALPAELVESELFGHEKGAFTGATERRLGRFELADGGTLFLDEIGELPLALQAKLLAVLQDGELQRVGGSATISVDVRVVAATNRDLKAEVEAGRFRSDLFFRLNVFPVPVPPLRERREDVPLLVRHFALKHGSRLGREIDSVPREALGALSRLPWPGNVRELENLVERAVILSRDGRLALEPLAREAAAASPGAAPVTLEEAQRRHIRDALERTGWKVSGPGGAAELLDVKPTTLESRMKKLGIERPG